MEILCNSKKSNRCWFIKASLVLILSLAFFWATFYFCIDKAQKDDMPGGISLLPVQVNEIYPSWLYYEVSPGQTVNSSFWVWNGYGNEAAVSLGSLDATEGSNLDSFMLKMVQDEQVGVGDWAKLSSSRVVLSPQSQEEVYFTMTIPEDAEEGTYYGAVYGSYSPDVTPDSPFRTVYQNGLRVIVRVTNMPQEVSMIGTNLWTLPQLSLTYLSVSVMITLGGLMSLAIAYRNAQD